MKAREMEAAPLVERHRARLLGGLAYDRLLGEIISGRLRAGDRIRLDELTHSWAVSRTPLREALLRLADMRLVDISPNAGTRVAAWSEMDMIERVVALERLVSADALARAAHAIGHLPSLRTGCEMAGYLHLADVILAGEFVRIGERLAGDCVEPLRRFLHADAAGRLGCDLESGRERRRALLAAALDALQRDDVDAAHADLRAFSAALVDALVPTALGRAPAGAPEPPPRHTHTTVHNSAHDAPRHELIRKAPP